MPKGDLNYLCVSVRRCIDDLNTLLEAAEELNEKVSGDCGYRAAKTAYNRLTRQLAARQSELEDRLQRVQAEGLPV